MAKIIPISEHFQHFLAEMKDEREFLGRFIRADEASLAAVFRAAVGAATRSLFGLGSVRTAAWPTASLSQRKHSHRSAGPGETGEPPRPDRMPVSSPSARSHFRRSGWPLPAPPAAC